MNLNASNSSFGATRTDNGVTCSLMGEYSWREEYLTPTNFIILVVIACAEGLMMPFIVSLNALVIWVVSSHRKLRRMKPCALLACLAATDLLVGAVALPLAITDHAMRLGARPSICVLERVAYDVVFVSCGASLCHLVLISGERYVAIKHSLRYETLVTTERLWVAIGVAWALPVVLICVPFLNVDNTAFRDLFMDVVVLFFTFSFMAVIGYCQVAMYLEGARHRRNILAHQVSEAAAREIAKKDKAARTTAMVSGALFVCYIPQAAVFAVFSALGIPTTSVFVTSLLASEAFVYLNSLISPLLYCVRTRDLRETVEEIFRPQQSKPEIKLGPVRRRVVPSRSENDGDVTGGAPRRDGHRFAWQETPIQGRRYSVRSLDLPKDPQHEGEMGKMPRRASAPHQHTADLRSVVLFPVDDDIMLGTHGVFLC